jgi:hypothetical protein
MDFDAVGIIDNRQKLKVDLLLKVALMREIPGYKKFIAGIMGLFSH